jgi:RNA ligase
MDGSLGILFHYEGEWVMATRGSFTSDQAVKGMEMLSNYDYNKLHKDFTYLFEIIYAENRIVCSYDFEDVVLLGSTNTKHGYEVNLHGDLDMRIQNLIRNIGLKVVKRYDGISDYSVLKQMVRDDAEGFIVLFSNGDRMKVKGVEYLRLHKIMTNVSTTGIWECLRNGDDVLEMMKEVPDEFYSKIKSYVKDLRYAHYSISEYCGKMHDGFRYGKYGDVDPEPTKKEYAEFVMKNIKEGLRGVMFQMWDKKDYDETIWRLIRPEFKKL